MIEEAGTPVGLLVPGPASSNSCQFNTKCLVGDTNCQTPNLVYEVTCKECPNSDPVSDPPSIYIGTTGANIHARSLTHKSDISAKKVTNSLYKHNLKFHSETHTESDRFSFKTLSTHSTVMSRLLTEAYKIAHSDKRLMNSKNEYGAGKWVSLETNKFST